MLTVEDGTGKADAESYVSVADADAYLLGRGNEAWAALDTGAKEAALRNATDYMTQVYRLRWGGRRYKIDQALDWPRIDAPRIDAAGGYRSYPNFYEYDKVPVEVARACALLAVRASADELSPDIERLTSSESVGEISVSYLPGGAPYVRYRSVDNLLSPLLGGAGGSRIRLSRG